LAPGDGSLTLGGFLDRDRAGARLSLEARISRALSGYGAVSVDWDRYWRRWNYGAEAGLRVRW